MAAGIIAGRPIVGTLRPEGSLSCASPPSDRRRRDFVPLRSRCRQLDRGPMALFYGRSELRLRKRLHQMLF